MPRVTRRASHAGSWYEADRECPRPRRAACCAARARRSRSPRERRAAPPGPPPPLPPPARRAAPTLRAWRPFTGRKLDRQIDGWMAAAVADAAARGPGAALPPRAIIGPHAGHRYCGHVMAHAYATIDPAAV
jgi:predicted class III extradiol MEMO1 family dioxygenase